MKVSILLAAMLDFFPKGLIPDFGSKLKIIFFFIYELNWGYFIALTQHKAK